MKRVQSLVIYLRQTICTTGIIDFNSKEQYKDNKHVSEKSFLKMEANSI